MEVLSVAQTIQALLLSALGAVGAYIAWQQMEIAGAKLRYELFEKRFSVFEAARAFLSDIMREGVVHDPEMWKYRAGIADALFLLDDDIIQYLEEIWSHAVDMRMYHTQFNDLPVGQERSELVSKNTNELIWLTDQITILPQKFKSQLHLRPLRRWPWQTK